MPILSCEVRQTYSCQSRDISTDRTDVNITLAITLATLQVPDSDGNFLNLKRIRLLIRMRHLRVSTLPNTSRVHYLFLSHGYL